MTVQIALLLMLTALTVSLWVQSNKMNQKSISARAAQAELFQGLFPQRRVPVGIRSQLKSELTRLQGMRGKSEAIPDAIESIDVLHRALASLPIEIRLRVSEVRIEDDRISIYGQVREHSDASRIVAELKKNGFDTPPPFTRRLRDFGFEFRISANHAVSKSEEDMGG